MSKQFLKICESQITRYTRGGFLIGDCIKFVDKFKSSESFKSMPAVTQKLIDHMIETGLNIRVTGINNKYPSRAPGNDENMNGEVALNIALDNSGGRYTHYCTIAPDLVMPLDFTPGLAPIPDALSRPNNTQIKPIEFKVDDKHISRQTMGNDRKMAKTQLSLPSKYVKIPSSTAKGASSPSVDGYTINYLKGF